MGTFFKKFISLIFQLTLMLVLPFWLLIRGSVLLYAHYEWHFSLALVLMFALVFFILLVYVAMVYDWLIGPNKMTRTSIKFKAFIVLLLMGVYLGNTLINLSGKNAKTEEVRSEYTSLHPYLRIATGTLMWLDQDLLVTDMARGQEDYGKMGLSSKKHSLHYPQSDGWVHAMDLRTNGRSEFRNNLLKAYFSLMGFNTLRHVGTADHLHVSLVSLDRPGAI
ncbi:hypothetical protein [Pontibacter sp. G13]|uniref:hypothetical protein n=1 Tax=Pontibacter sp. G13 TaxID=3074898 RepID=UPI00288B139D|nr:hypothetical protein [Pontibacter sp. G13]WNJ19515.1 hypothetical protein RJD25_03390 [Pontibacter sp. G13]